MWSDLTARGTGHTLLGESRMTFAGKHAIVTGGSSGIGRATAHLLAQRGAHVSIIARAQAALDETLGELDALRVNGGQRFRAVSADLGDWPEARDAIAVLASNGHAPDLLINAAGYCHPGYFEKLPVDVFHDSMRVDFFGTLHPIKAVTPLMIARGQGHIVTFSSVAGFYGIYGFTAYTAAKYAITGFSEVLRQELKPYGIAVSVVFPPTTCTPGLERENRLKPLETKLIEGQSKERSPKEVAEAVLRGIERRTRYILPGADTKLYFLVAHLPPRLVGVLEYWLIDRMIAKAQRIQQ
jgi:3-dehydrosphinganine reductase